MIIKSSELLYQTYNSFPNKLSTKSDEFQQCIAVVKSLFTQHDDLMRKINMNKSVPFNKFYRLFNIISSLLIVLSIVLLIFKGLNFGVDFKGGTLIELRTTDKNISVSNIRDSLNQLNLGDVSV